MWNKNITTCANVSVNPQPEIPGKGGCLGEVSLEMAISENCQVGKL